MVGDLQKVFLQAWKEDPNQIKILRLKRLVFGLVQSHFISEGTIDKHLSNYTEKYPAEVADIKDDLYVDDLITGGENFE